MFRKMQQWWLRRRLARPISAVTYYVSLDGSDENDGLHPLRAWKTIEQLNRRNMQIKACDQILFRRGYTYLGRPYYLQKPATARPKLGAYGSGSYPVFPDVKNQQRKAQSEEPNIK